MAVEITSSDIFTPEQLTKHSKIFAGPGAGKTHFLVENIKNIVSTNNLIVRSHLRKVLCITYTNAAVNEIKRRLDNFTDYVETYTIHGFIIEHIIKPFQQDLRELMKTDFDISVCERGAISSQVEGLGILHGISKEDIFSYIKQTNPEEFASHEFGYSKKDMSETEVDNNAYVSSKTDETLEGMLLKAPSRILGSHIKPLKQFIWSEVRKLTHNEILYFGYRILESNPTALYALRVKFPFVFVDEFQDTNPIQTLLIKLIGQKSTVVGIVGDVAQSIYSFQGAKPSDFMAFAINSERKLNEYVINDNRRSTHNIVNFCNFLRQSDESVVQKSARNEVDEKRTVSEAIKIHFLVGDSVTIKEIISNALKEGAVVLTRVWAAAFSYIEDVDEKQVKFLKDIYNSYFNSTINLRDEIIENNNVTWVRAFRFIFSLWEGYNSGSFVDIIRALRLYTEIDVRKLTPKIIFQIKKLSVEVFNTVTLQSITVDIIKFFNQEIVKTEYKEFYNEVFAADFSVPIFDELDKDKLVSSVSCLIWDTSYKLFYQVFSEDSKYMTVHQAKGLEWDKVIVSVAPSRNDGTKLENLYASPQLVAEEPAEEFTRIYYVACSRAKEDLYIHIPNQFDKNIIETSIKTFMSSSGLVIGYEMIF